MLVLSELIGKEKGLQQEKIFAHNKKKLFQLIFLRSGLMKIVTRNFRFEGQSKGYW
jgi:hypothetical protein